MIPRRQNLSTLGHKSSQCYEEDAENYFTIFPVHFITTRSEEASNNSAHKEFCLKRILLIKMGNPSFLLELSAGLQ